MNYRAVNSLGSARVSRAGFGVAAKRSSIVDLSHNGVVHLEKSATVKTPSLPQARNQTRALPNPSSYACCN